jgi:hypothetical protein
MNWYRAAREARVNELVAALLEHARTGRRQCQPAPFHNEAQGDYDDARDVSIHAPDRGATD